MKLQFFKVFSRLTRQCVKGEPSLCPPGTWNSFSVKQMDEEKERSTDVDEDVGAMRMEEGQEPRQSLELNRTGHMTLS